MLKLETNDVNIKKESKLVYSYFSMQNQVCNVIRNNIIHNRVREKKLYWQGTPYKYFEIYLYILSAKEGAI